MDFHKILSKLTALESKSPRTLRESVEIKADGAEAMALLGHPEATLSQPPDDFGTPEDFSMPDTTMPPAEVDTDSNMTLDDLQRLSGIDPVEEEVDTLYANTPDEDIKPLSAAFPSGNDLHKEKRSYRASAPGDNPSAVATLEEKLMKSLQEYLNESDIGKPGKNFEKIAKSAGKEYGSEEAGKRVAGAVLKKLRKAHPKKYKA